MKTSRHLTLAIFFIGLIALEIAHGVFRLNTIHEGHRRGLLASIERGHNELALEVRRGLAEEREHAAYLARMPAVRALLEDPAPGPTAPAEASPRESARKTLEANLLPYVVSFRGIDRVCILDAAGRERFRCERIGKGVGAIPEVLLDPVPDAPVVALAKEAKAGEVVISGLVLDSRRVEVPPGERQVLHFGTGIDRGPTRIGLLVLTVYAAPILGRIRGFAPLPGVTSALVDERGAYLAHVDRPREAGGPSARTLHEDHSGAAERILSGSEKAMSRGAALLGASATGSAPRWRIVTTIPDSALDAASGSLRGEYAWVIASMVLTTVLLTAAGALLVRMSIREVELREAARYKEKQAEMARQVQLSERLGSLGLLTAGVAHEINNPLEGIENYLALLERDAASPEKRKRYIEMVRYGFHRIRDIVRDLSTFAKPSVGGGMADLALVVRQATKMVRYAKDFKQVEVEVRGLDSPLHVPGDGGRLEQVFINLFLNAAKAMKGEGTIRVTAREHGFEGRGPAVEVTVDDTGPGIPERILPRIFDPFFTTGDGTGLGLSISYGILRAHGGTVRAENRTGGGARFTLQLPAAEPAAMARAGEGEARSET